MKLYAALMLAASFPARLAFAESAAAGSMQTEEQKTLYTLGVVVGSNLAPFRLSSSDLKYVSMGLRDAVASQNPQVDLNVYGPKIRELQDARQAQGAKKEKQKADGFLKEAAKAPGAKSLPSGLIYSDTKAGSGTSPKASDTIKAHYQGALTDGSVFDSSYQRGSPTEFPLNGVIPCWTEGIQKMKVGGKARLVCPSKIAYGDGGNPPKIPGGATLVFDVELVEIIKK